MVSWLSLYPLPQAACLLFKYDLAVIGGLTLASNMQAARACFTLFCRNHPVPKLPYDEFYRVFGPCEANSARPVPSAFASKDQRRLAYILSEAKKL